MTCVLRWTRFFTAGWSQHIPFLDHNPPSLRQIKLFCHSVDKWLKQVCVCLCASEKEREGAGAAILRKRERVIDPFS